MKYELASLYFYIKKIAFAKLFPAFDFKDENVNME